MRPSRARDGYGVALVGEALGADEAEHGRPFVGRAGHKLTRLIEWAGLDRAKFDIYNTVWCRPPNNKLEGLPFEDAAIAHCHDAHWGSLLDDAKVIVPMGNVPMNVFLGRKGITKARGYVYERGGRLIIPTVHPSFIQRGQAKYSAAFINDLQKAVDLATNGYPVISKDYVLDPLPIQAMEWAKAYRAALEADPTTKLAYDIETPGKGEDESEAEADDPTYTIWRISFSYRRDSGMSIPWRPEYMPVIRLILESPGDKVDWNGAFDRPRVRANGIELNGVLHDGMWAWHVWHSDLPKGLGFVATFTCPWQPPWKHLSSAQPAYYNAVDADVTLQSFEVIEDALRREGLWEVYQEDVIELDPVLKAMTRAGMPVDREVRVEKAVQLQERIQTVISRMEEKVPVEIRTKSPKEGFVRAPEDTSGLIQISVNAVVKRCSQCGAVSPTKPHFKTFKRPTAKRPQNPCAGATVVEAVESVNRFARLDPFKPSRHLILRYQNWHGRIVPKKWDKKDRKQKPNTDEKAMKILIGKYPDDPFYPDVLEYRELTKVAGTYIGVPEETNGL